MKLTSFIKTIGVDLFRFFFKGARVDAALTWAGRARLNAGDASIREGAVPVDIGEGRIAYNADDVIRRWIVKTHAKLTLKNNSSYPAYKVTLINANEIFDTIERLPTLLSLAPNEEREFKIEFIQTCFAVSGVDADKLPAIPAEKQNKRLKIQYENEKGTKLYTKFNIAFGEPFNEYFY
jgi:hypothetical protein